MARGVAGAVVDASGCNTGCPKGGCVRACQRSDARGSTSGSTAAAGGCIDRGEARVHWEKHPESEHRSQASEWIEPHERSGRFMAHEGASLHHREERRRYTLAGDTLLTYSVVHRRVVLGSRRRFSTTPQPGASAVAPGDHHAHRQPRRGGPRGNLPRAKQLILRRRIKGCARLALQRYEQHSSDAPRFGA